MSTYWDLECADCGVSLGFHWRSGEEELQVIWKHRQAFVGFRELFTESAERKCYISLDVRWSSSPSAPSLLELSAFVERHNNCNVKPKNEYGEWFDQCAKRIICGECGAYHKCRRDKAHDGSCSHDGT